jgi:hypothetical protein
LSEMVDEVSEEEAPADIKRARLIIENVMTNEPFTTIDLNSNGKYRKYFGGPEAVDTEAILPIFGAPLVRLNSDKPGALYPIYKLSDMRGTYHSFDIQVNKPLDRSQCYVLSNKDLPNSTEIRDTEEGQGIPEAWSLSSKYAQNGWRVFLIKMGKGSDEYSDIEGKESGTRQGISMAYHPATTSIRSEADEVIGYENSELGLNTSEALFAGPLTVRSGMAMAFPPTPLAGVSNVGIPLPLDYKGTDIVNARKKLFPVVGTRIPVEIESEESMASVSVDMSDFLLRDPPEEAWRILNKIERAHEMYKRDVNLAGGDKAPRGMLVGLRKKYRSIISGLHSTYRGLPLLVHSDKIATSKAGFEGGIHNERGDRAARFKARVSAYLPFTDWVTMHKMVSSEAFGPEWGGHQIWSTDDSGTDLQKRRTEALETFIIKAHSLEHLAEQIGYRLDSIRRVPRGTVLIDPVDLLDPVRRLFSKGILSSKEARDIFGYNYDDDLEADVHNMANAPWLSVSPEKREKAMYNAGKKMETQFPTWVKGPGAFHSVGTVSGKDSVSEDPLAYIRIMNVVFPSNAVSAGDTYSPRERLERVRSSDHSDIITIDDLYDYDIISGAGTDPIYFPLPEDEAGLKKYRKSLKGVRHISVARYAEAMSEYLADFVRQDLFQPLEKGQKKESVTSFGLVKFSEKRNANMYSGGIINDEGLLALWNLINK